MRQRYYILLIYSLLFSTVAFVACNDESDGLTSVRYDLIGHGVRFTTSMAEPFTTRTTYRRDGSFNEEDIMTIYRQYSPDGGLSFDATTEAYRVYSLTTKYATGTSFALETDWKPKVGATGSNSPGDTFIQTDADSLTWDNGQTVRFRAWSRSNLAGAIENGSKERYYPDYCVSEWVTVSGPTMDVPLTLKHQGCRIEFTAKGGNELQRAEICTEVEDYRRRDNSTDRDHDESSDEHGKSLAKATEECNAVNAVYNQMCMPAGADVETALLTTMTKALYDGTSDFKNISLSPTGIVGIGTKTPDQIRDEVQRPVFCKNDGRLDMITIPYDMSNDDKKGESLTLPACTRIKIWLLDVNNGDASQSTGEEGTYHIFTLGDIMNKDGSATDRKPLFPDGMELKPGYSYRFDVGYQYGQMTITPADNFSWVLQDEENGTAINEVKEQPETGTYTWWKTAIEKAIPKKIEDSYNPEFHITTQAEFLEFIKLVNGTAVNDYVKDNKLVYALRPEKNYNKVNPALQSDYRWYKEADVSDGIGIAGRDSITHEWAIEQGYIFFQHYHSANADQAAYSMEDYLHSPYSFYDEDLDRHFTVYLDNDLDLYDWQLDPIGNEDPTVRLTAENSHPFRGIFDGYNATTNTIATLKNINMNGGYMFRHCFDAAIRNLKIETTHDFMLVNTAEAKYLTDGYGAYIVGVSIKAPSSGNPIARELKGSSYVVGCYYEGWAGGAMVGTADNLNMYGNMMAASGLKQNTGALLGAYPAGVTADSDAAFFRPQKGQKVEWGRFMANYYLMDHYNNKNAADIVHAVGAIADNYRPQEYIRGGLAWVLKAKNDNLLSSEVPYNRLTTELMRKGYYGLAPWKAMNYAIKKYNDVGAEVKIAHNCKGHYVNDSDGYAHTFPRLVPGEPNSAYDHTGLNYADDGGLNILELNN